MTKKYKELQHLVQMRKNMSSSQLAAAESQYQKEVADLENSKAQLTSLEIESRQRARDFFEQLDESRPQEIKISELRSLISSFDQKKARQQNDIANRELAVQRAHDQVKLAQQHYLKAFQRNEKIDLLGSRFRKEEIIMKEITGDGNFPGE